MTGDCGKLTKLKSVIPVQTIGLEKIKQAFEFEHEFYWKKQSDLDRTLQAVAVSSWDDARMRVFADGAAWSPG